MRKFQEPAGKEPRISQGPGGRNFRPQAYTGMHFTLALPETTTPRENPTHVSNHLAFWYGYLVTQGHGKLAEAVWSVRFGRP
jgi:hypothetical protein